jgi:hypothetical protein
MAALKRLRLAVGEWYALVLKNGSEHVGLVDTVEEISGKVSFGDTTIELQDIDSATWAGHTCGFAFDTRCYYVVMTFDESAPRVEGLCTNVDKNSVTVSGGKYFDSALPLFSHFCHSFDSAPYNMFCKAA